MLSEKFWKLKKNVEWKVFRISTKKSQEIGKLKNVGELQKIERTNIKSCKKFVDKKALWSWYTKKVKIKRKNVKRCKKSLKMGMRRRMSKGKRGRRRFNDVKEGLPMVDTI